MLDDFSEASLKSRVVLDSLDSCVNGRSFGMLLSQGMHFKENITIGIQADAGLPLLPYELL